MIPNALDLEWIDRPGESGTTRLACATRPAWANEIVLLSVGRLEAEQGISRAGGRARRAARARRRPLRDDSGAGSSSATDRSAAVLEQRSPTRGLRDRTLFLGRTDDQRAARVVRGRDPVRAPDALRRQLARHARSDGAPPRGRRVDAPAGCPTRSSPGVNGWLVPPGDPSALAAAISGAIADPERLIQMGEAGRRLIVREFSWDAAVAATLRLYEEVLR